MNSDLDVEIVVGQQHTGGPMHVARCVNDAASRATGDVFVLWGADHWPDADCMRWLSNTMSGDPSRVWQPLFECTGVMTRDQTHRLLIGGTFKPSRVRFAVVAPLCVGIFAVRREAFFEVGMEDERFVGWGMEDAALRHTLVAFYGESSPPVKGSVLKALWHPVQPHDDEHAQANVKLYHEEYLARGLDKVALSSTISDARQARLSGVHGGS